MAIITFTLLLKSWIVGPRTLSEKAHLTRGQTYLSQVEMVPEVHIGMGFK